MAGQVPGLGLINGVVAAEAALAAYETSNTAAVDALVAKLAATDFNTNTSALAADADYDAKLAAIKADAALATAAKTGTTNTLNANVLDRTAEVKAIKDGLTTDADKALVADFDAAVAANAALTAPSAADVGAAQGGLGADAGFATSVTAINALTLSGGKPTVVTAADVYDLYVDADTTSADRAQLDTALKSDAYASSASFKATAAAAIAKNAAQAKEDAAKLAVDGDADTAAYSGKVADLATAKEALAAAQSADANQTAADTIAANQKAQEDKVAAATKAIDDFNTANSGTATVQDITKATFAIDTVKDTFYFAEKATAADDIVLGTQTFGAGDSIVVGSSYAYNSGALTTGDNNKAEFFLVQKGNDTLVIIETAAYGSSTTTHTATGDVAAVGSDDAAVITLTGVAVADLTVNNGVISHVA